MSLYKRLKCKQSAGIDIQYRDPFTRSELLAVLAEIDEGLGIRWHYPIIHLECHGSDSGVQLRMKEFLEWAEFQDRLALITAKSGFNHLLVLGSCFGMRFIHAFDITRPSPCSVLLASPEKVSPADLATRFLGFYERIFEGGDASEAARNMNTDGDVSQGVYGLMPAALLFDAAYKDLMKRQQDPNGIQRWAKAFQKKAQDAGFKVSIDEAKDKIIHSTPASVERIKGTFLHQSYTQQVDGLNRNSWR